MKIRKKVYVGLAADVMHEGHINILKNVTNPYKSNNCSEKIFKIVKNFKKPKNLKKKFNII